MLWCFRKKISLKLIKLIYQITLIFHKNLKVSGVNHNKLHLVSIDSKLRPLNAVKIEKLLLYAYR